MPTRLRVIVIMTALAGLPGWGLAGEARAQSPVVALRTNGSVVRPGDCLRLEMLALDYVAGPLATQVTYRYATPVIVKDKDGQESASTRTAEVRRPAGPVIDALNHTQFHLLDDTFCFGQSGLPGRYDVEVSLRSGAAGAPFATLRTCVIFEDPDAPAAAGQGCGFLVRGLKRVDSDNLLVFDADLPAGGFYRGAVLRGGSVEAEIYAGVSQSGPHELTVLLPTSSLRAGSAVDLVLVDQFSQTSSTVARLSVPSLR